MTATVLIRPLQKGQEITKDPVRGLKYIWGNGRSPIKQSQAAISTEEGRSR
jgi:hypothetical protein